MDEIEQRLYDAVLADLRNDGPREVYADWLEARGDPRGTYLRLETVSRETDARLRALRQQVPADWRRAVAHPGRGGSSPRSFDLTLTLVTARLPNMGGQLAVMARAHGCVFEALSKFYGDTRGTRSVFTPDRSFEAPLTLVDVPRYFALLEALGDLKAGDVDLEGIPDSSDYGHVATLQGALDGVAFRASVSFLSSGFTGRDAVPFAALARHLLEGSQIEEPALTEGARPADR